MEDFLEALQKMIRGEFLPEYRPFDKKIKKDTLANHLASLTELGFLPAEKDNAKEALWVDEEPMRQIEWYGEILSSLGEVSSDLALAAHQQGIDQRFREILQNTSKAAVLPGLSGYLGRGSFGRLWKNASLSSEDERILAAAYPDVSERVLHLSLNPPEEIIFPVYDGKALGWAMADVIAKSEAKQSGFDATSLYVFPVKKPKSLNTENPLGLLIQLSVINSIGMAAMERGILRRTLTVSTEYTQTRYQGGRLIREYPAVQRLLFAIRRANILYDDFFNRLSLVGSITPVEAARIMASTTALKNHAYEAATSAVQVHGGYGYMEDYGMERALRDIRFLGSWPFPKTETELFLQVALSEES